jgi:hypothetical protein
MPSKIKQLRKADINHRKQYEKFVLKDGHPTVSMLLILWNYWNEHFFDNSFKAPPIILLAEPSKPSVLGSYSVIGAYGNRAQIRIRPSLMSGTHPHMLPGEEYRKGRFLFVSDVCLHETIHLWQDEVMGDLEGSYHGHGPLFRDKCNEIGEKLGLPPVRTCKKRGKDAELPSCSLFPHNVRPLEYYRGAYVQDADEPRPLRGRLERLLKDFTGEEIVQELKAMDVLETRHQYRGQKENPVEIFSATKTGADEPIALKHSWFLDTFNAACRENGINPDLRLTPSLASTLDDWLDKRLSKGRYHGRTFFCDENINNIKEKLSQIVSQWEFIEISYLGKRIEVPPVPDLSFLVSHREALFGWVSELRQRQTDASIDRLLVMGMQC